MPVSSTDSRVAYTLTATGQTLAVPFVFFDNSDLEVSKIASGETSSSPLTITTDYTVSGGSGSNGSITLLVAAAAIGDKIVIVRNLPFSQLFDAVEGDPLPASALVQAIDKLCLLLQQLNRTDSYAVRLAATGDSFDALEDLNRANKALGFDASGNLTTLDGAALVAFMNLAATVVDLPVKIFADSSQRAAAVPDFQGQPGIQLDQLPDSVASSLYIAHGTAAGNWTIYTPDISDDSVTLDKLAHIGNDQLFGTNSSGIPVAVAKSAFLLAAGSGTISTTLLANLAVTAGKLEQLGVGQFFANTGASTAGAAKAGSAEFTEGTLETVIGWNSSGQLMKQPSSAISGGAEAFASPDSQPGGFSGVWRNSDGTISGIGLGTHYNFGISLSSDRPINFAQNVTGFTYNYYASAWWNENTAGEFYTVGQCNNSELGQGTSNRNAVKIAYFGTNSLKVKALSLSHEGNTSSSGQSAYVIAEDAGGTTRVYGCGYNAFGQLGDGTIAAKTAWVQWGAVTGISSVQCGYETGYSVAVLLTGGGVHTCGNGGSGRLGNGGTANISTPVEILTGVTLMGYNGFEGLAWDGSALKGWGQNTAGSIGNASTGQETSPVTITFAATPAKFAMGLGSVAKANYILDTAGEIWGAGDAAAGQLGMGSTTDSTSFVKPAGSFQGSVLGISTMGGASAQTVIAWTATSVHGAGYNGSGQLATGNNTNQTSFVECFKLTDGATIVDARALGHSAVCYNVMILDSLGRVWVSGYAGYGLTGYTHASSHLYNFVQINS